MRTGIRLDTACTCSNSHASMLNCAGASTVRTLIRGRASPSGRPRLKDTLIRRTVNSRLMRVASCACTWCEGNRSHVMHDTEAR